jgi:chemotaxis protein CheX
MTRTTPSIVIAEMLNGMIHGMSTVIPKSITKGQMERLEHSLTQPEMGVLIGITGDSQSRMIIEGKLEAFSSLANHMFGMTLEGEMLESFVGEIGNMVGGSMCTYVSNQGISLDITHPTVLVGKTKLTGFQTALSMPLLIESIGDLRISLLLEAV